MRGSGTSYIGANEVNHLVGRWQEIVGSAPFTDILGADVSYTNPYWQRQQQQRPWWQHRHHRHHHQGPGWPERDHRLQDLGYRAYIMGDPVACGALALMGAEAAAAAAPPGVAPAAPAQLAAAAAAPAAPPVGPIAPPAPPTTALAPHPAAAPPATLAPVGPEVPPEHPAHPNGHLPPHHPDHPGHPQHPQHRRFRATGGWAPAMVPVPMWGDPGMAWANGGSWPYTIPPRNLLVDRPGPIYADRVILPLSSGVNILPNTSAQITARPQLCAFRPERCILQGPDNWVINDVKVGNQSQFAQSGDIPGEVFGSTTIDAFLKFTTVQTAMDFVVVATFVGASESGAPFVCAVLGTGAVN
jgi:hypothetical protein